MDAKRSATTPRVAAAGVKFEANDYRFYLDRLSELSDKCEIKGQRGQARIFNASSPCPAMACPVT